MVKQTNISKLILFLQISIAIVLFAILFLLGCTGDSSSKKKNKGELKTTSIPTLKASKPIHTEIDSLDLLAHLMQLELTNAIKSKIKDTLAFSKLANAWLISESILDTAINDAWNSFPEINEQVFHTNKIIEFAGFNLGIETRRFYGPNFHTLVPGLINGKGCKGDIVMDRIIINYFKIHN